MAGELVKKGEERLRTDVFKEHRELPETSDRFVPQRKRSAGGC